MNKKNAFFIFPFSLQRKRGLFLLVISFVAFSTHALYGNLFSFGDQKVGSVNLPSDAIEKGDFLIMVFSEDLKPDPILQSEPVIPVSDHFFSGCLSVATIHLHSGQAELLSPGRLTFGCDNVPEEAQVYGWIDQQWKKVPTFHLTTGMIEAEFTELTTYAIFTKEPNEIPSQNGQI